MVLVFIKILFIFLLLSLGLQAVSIRVITLAPTQNEGDENKIGYSKGDEYEDLEGIDHEHGTQRLSLEDYRLGCYVFDIVILGDGFSIRLQSLIHPKTIANHRKMSH